MNVMLGVVAPMVSSRKELPLAMKHHETAMWLEAWRPSLTQKDGSVEGIKGFLGGETCIHPLQLMKL